MTVSDTIPAQSFRSYVSLVWANVQAAGALNMQAIEVQPLPVQCLKLHQSVDGPTQHLVIANHKSTCGLHCEWLCSSPVGPLQRMCATC